MHFGRLTVVNYHLIQNLFRIIWQQHEHGDHITCFLMIYKQFIITIDHDECLFIEMIKRGY